MSNFNKDKTIDELNYCPEYIRVGCYTYKIIPMEEDEFVLTQCYGYFNETDQTIHIRAKCTPQNMANTLLHEVLHSIHRVYGVDDDSTEEEFTTQTANGLSAFFIDNPHVTSWYFLCLMQRELTVMTEEEYEDLIDDEESEYD